MMVEESSDRTVFNSKRFFLAVLTDASVAVGTLGERRISGATALAREEGVVMTKLLIGFVKDEGGATAIEYGLIAALIAVGIIAAARGLGSQIAATFNTVATTMQGA